MDGLLSNGLAPKIIAIGRELLDARVGGRSSMSPTEMSTIILPSGFGLRGESVEINSWE